MLLEGRDPGQIARDAATAFGISERQARNYIARAEEQIRGILQVDRAFRMAEHVAARRDMRARAQKANDLRAELDVLKDEAKLLGLYPSERHEVSGPDGKPLNATPPTVNVYLPDNGRDDRD